MQKFIGAALTLLIIVTTLGCAHNIPEFKPDLEEISTAEARVEMPAPPRIVTDTTALGEVVVDTIPGTRGNFAVCGDKNHFRIYVGEDVEVVNVEFKMETNSRFLVWETVAERTISIKENRRILSSFFVPEWPLQHEVIVRAYISQEGIFEEVSKARERFDVHDSARCGQLRDKRRPI